MADLRILVGDNGEPLGGLDVDVINAEATIFAYALAHSARDPEQMRKVAAATLAQVGAEAFGYVAAGAAMTLAEHVVEPLLQVCDEVGLTVDMREGLMAAYANALATLRPLEDGGDGR